MTDYIDVVKSAVADGILGSELCPEPGYWHWPVVDADRLPVALRHSYAQYGEVRWFGYNPYNEHNWVGGMCHVHSDDADTVNAERLNNGLTPLECETCEVKYGEK